MPFTMTLSFAKEQDRDAFVEKAMPKVRGHQVDPEADELADAEGISRIAITVTSPTAARDVASHTLAFLAHAKNSRVDFSWTSHDGTKQIGEINAGSAREADLLAIRLATAAKIAIDAGKDA